MEGLDLLALFHVALHRDLHPVPQPPDVYLQYLDRAFDVGPVHLIRPAVHVPNPPPLAGDAHALSKTGPHPPLCEPPQRVLHLPPLLADQIAAGDGPAAAFASLAMHNRDPLPSFFPLPLPLLLLPLAVIQTLQPVPHARHDARDQREGRRVVVRPGEVVDASVDLRVRIPRPLGAELPDRPVRAVPGVEEAHQGIGRVAVCALRVRRGGARGDDDCGAERSRELVSQCPENARMQPCILYDILPRKEGKKKENGTNCCPSRSTDRVPPRDAALSAQQRSVGGWMPAGVERNRGVSLSLTVASHT